MSEENEVEFGDLTIEEKVKAVDDRIGNHDGRISDPRDLLGMEGNTIHMVISPFGKDNNLGNGIMLPWKVGKIADHRGNAVAEGSELTFDNGEKYVCYDFDDADKGISLKDFNIVPNSYNNHAAFISEEDANAYAMYRKMLFEEDTNIAELEGDYDPFFTGEDIERLVKSENTTEDDDSDED